MNGRQVLCARAHLSKNTAFTLLEMLVVVTIIAILMALMLPAIQASREAARRAACMNNLKSLCIAALSFESATGNLPPAGRGLSSPKSWPVATITVGDHSTNSWILGYLEDLPKNETIIRTDRPYSDPDNQRAGEVLFRQFLCPSAAGEDFDAAGQYRTDYAAVSLVVIPVSKNGRITIQQQRGMLEPYQKTAAAVHDGMGRTIMFVESAGGFGSVPANLFDFDTNGDGVPDASRRWISPYNSIFASKPPNSDRPQKASCPWSTVDCGMNDEAFSFHPGGVLAVVGDGRVIWLSDGIAASVYFALLTSDGKDFAKLPKDFAAW